MTYVCIKECINLDLSLLIPKQWFLVGKVYEFEHEPDKRFFKKQPTTQRKNSKRKKSS